MKKLQLAFAALVLASTISFAQPANPSERKAHGKHHEKNNLDELNLSNDQKAQMQAANAAFKAQMKALKSDETQTVKQQRDKMAELVQAHKTKLDDMLTAEQKAKRAELKATATQQHGEMSAKHLERMQKELNLSNEQVNQLKSSDEALKGKFESINNNAGLDAATKRRQLTALKAERKATMDKVLTVEQKQKFQDMHKGHKGKMKRHTGERNKEATV